MLFDGKDLSQWVSQSAAGGPAPWVVADGVATVKPGSGGIQTKQAFGSASSTSSSPRRRSSRATARAAATAACSCMNNYELQILDSYQNPTYFHGQAGAIYKQHAPLVNASRKPGEWQAYDVVFHAPKFDADGKLIQRATFTVFHNGVLIQDHVIVMGVTSHDKPPYYEAHAAKMPLSLQDHHNPMRFRNIWIREL